MSFMQLVMDRIDEALAGLPVTKAWNKESNAIAVGCSDETIEFFPTATCIRVARVHSCGEICWSLEPDLDTAIAAARQLVVEINP